MAKKANRTPKKTQPNIKKSRLSVKALWIFVISFAVIGGLLLLVSKAATPPAAPNIYLTPDSQNLNVGDTFTVDIYEDSGSNSVNGVQAQLSYPTSQMSYISHTDSTNFPLVGENPAGDTGTLHFARATCGGCAALTGGQTVVSVTFKALSAGAADINFLTDSNGGQNGGTIVALSNGTAEPGLNMAGGSYTIAAPAGTPPPGGGGGGGSGGGGGTTSPPKTTTTHHTTTSTNSSPSTAPTAPAASAPTQTSNTTATSSLPATTSTEPPLISAGVMRLIKISGVAAVLAVAITVFAYAWDRMKWHLRLASNHNYGGGGALTMPAAAMPAPPPPPAVTVKPTSKNTPPTPAIKTIPTANSGDKPQPGSVLKPNSNKKS